MNSAILSRTDITRTELSKRIDDTFPGCGFAHLPTPLERMEKLSKRLNGVNLFIKRDDQTGLAFGGNKTRKLDLIMADVLERGCDSVITWAGIQSNWCRQTVAAARKVGVKPILILFNRSNLPSEVDGNYFIDLLFNAEVKIVEVETGANIMDLDAVSEYINEAVDRETKKGNKPYVASIGGSVTEGSMTQPLGAISYTSAFLEIAEQTAAQDVFPDYIVLASGSGSTHAGLTVGAQLVRARTKIVGISVSGDKAEVTDCVKTIAEETLEALGETADLTDGVIVFDDYNKKGYGILNKEIVRAISLVAETEGILLDPVYTGKAMAGLLDLIERGYFEKGENIVFLHSGGTPALFPYREQIMDYLGNNNFAG